MSADYRVAPIFLIRLAGVPFDVLEKLGTQEVSAAARTELSAEAEREAAKKEVWDFVSRRESGLNRDEYKAWKSALAQNQVGPPNDQGRGTEQIARYHRAVDEFATVSLELDRVAGTHLAHTRSRLQESAKHELPSYLVFAAPGTRHILENPEEGARNRKARERERHLLLYLQRVAAKNDTFSAFGPSAWGRAVAQNEALKLSVQEGIAERLVFFERWVAHAVAGAIAHDEEVAPELRPQVPALDPFALETIRQDITLWPEGPARQRWKEFVDGLTDLAATFRSEGEPVARGIIMEQARQGLAQLGVERTGQRSLYAATNPIAEECSRGVEFVIKEEILNEVAQDAAPWIDLWRDTYAFVASRVAKGLRTLHQKVADGRPVPLLHFLRACAEASLPLQGHGLVVPAAVAFQEVKAAFRKRLTPHAHEDEYELTAADCAVVRDRFDFESFEEFTWPSADLQLAAASVTAVNDGRYRWILSELHPPVAMLHHCMWWSCPDKPELSKQLHRIGGRLFHFGFVPADFTAHTTLRIFEAMPELATFVAPQRGNDNWKHFSPEEAEVFLADDDVRVRHAHTGEDIGSFARSWLIPLGFHPFQFGLPPHTPRLRCGNVVVQRQTWTVTENEMSLPPAFGVRDLVLGVERLRAARGLPRYIYMRPTEQALRRAGAENRDKDTKPVFVDLESILSVEVFQRWLAKAGEVEITEMLPGPDELLWQEEDGRRTFELRTLIVPR